MIINSSTKIAVVLKNHPDALEAIISISPSFEKLRNPFLRKLMAGRTSIATASKISKCTVEDFYKKLEPLGFEVDRKVMSTTQKDSKMPSLIANLSDKQITCLDVRPLLSSGEDPLKLILESAKLIELNQALKIINTFEPVPLIKLLEKKGFVSFTKQVDAETTETYLFKKQNELPPTADAVADKNNLSWDTLLHKYENNIHYIDVRNLEMPQPMIKILEAIETLAAHEALFVFHKRVPMFLIPELSERKLTYSINEIKENEVHLLIYKE